MFDKFITAIVSFINRVGDAQTETQQVTVEMQQKPVKFKSFFLLGDAFYAFHNDAEPKNFIKWLKEIQKEWYKANRNIVEDFSKLTFPEMIETIYGYHNANDLYCSLADYLRKWFVLEHGRFSFPQTERTFVPLVKSHLLQVLYDASDDEIKIIDSSDRIEEMLPSAEDYKNNLIIGTDSHVDLEYDIVDYLVSNADNLRAHFKLINDDKTRNERYLESLSNHGITNFVEIKFQSVTTEPNDKVTNKRYNRYYQFNNFANGAENIFKSFLAKTPKAKRFDDSFMLSIWNDKNHPKNDATYVNVAFGNRILTVSHHNKGFSSTTEQGARLCFYRMETGEVNITIYPAQTDSRKPVEDAIIIYNSIAPYKLNKKKLKSLWKTLISYMECTSIDGDPSFWQKRKIMNLRYCHNMIVGNVHQPTKRSVSWQKIREFVFSVGLSGCVLALLQLAYNMFNPDTTSVSNKNEIVLHIDSLQNALRQSTDTISSKIIHSKVNCQIDNHQNIIDAKK